MKKDTTLINVIDLEATCWNTKQEKQQNTSEIIEIGIAVVSTKELAIVDTGCLLIKPLESRVSPFCTELTTLTAEKLEQNGGHFENALAILAAECDSRNRPWMSWGDYDRTMLQKQCARRNHKYPFGPRHTNLKTLFSVLYGFDSEMGLGQAMRLAHLEFTGTPHRGVADARNIAQLLLTLIERVRA